MDVLPSRATEMTWSARRWASLVTREYYTRELAALVKGKPKRCTGTRGACWAAESASTSIAAAAAAAAAASSSISPSSTSSSAATATGEPV